MKLKITTPRLLFIAVVLVLILAVLLLSEPADKKVLVIDDIEAESPQDIIMLSDSLVIPAVYSQVGFLKSMEMEKRKEMFVAVVLPSVLVAKHRLMKERQQVRTLQKKTEQQAAWSQADSAFIRQKYTQYRAESTEELLLKMAPHPNSLVIAQAALESGWGTSRFFTEANNIFGVWSFNRSEPRIAASQSRNGKVIYLRKYENIMESVEDYFHILARGHAYTEFRAARAESDNVYELIWYLKNYSEKRNQYVIMLRNVIVANNLTRYDSYRLHPDYFVYQREIDEN